MISRRLFVTAALAVPVAALAAQLPKPRDGVFIHKGNTSGRWRAGCSSPVWVDYNKGSRKWTTHDSVCEWQL